MDFELEFALQIARQALETRLISELEEKHETFFTGADATLDLCALGEKQEFCVELVHNGMRELVDFKTEISGFQNRSHIYSKVYYISTKSITY